MAASAARSRRGWRCTRGRAPPSPTWWSPGTPRTQGTEIKLARSTDGGRTFGPPVSLQSAGAAGDRGWHSLALDDQGTAHVLWLDHRGLAGRPTERSKAGEHQHKGEHDGVAMAQMSRLRYATFGARASADRELTPGVCYCCKTAVVALPGGTVVSAWRHVYAGNLRDIAFTESRDGGATFAAAGAGQRGRLGDQRLSRRRAGAGGRPGGRRAHRVADRDPRRRADRRALLRADAGDGRLRGPRPHPDAGQPEAVASAGGGGRHRAARSSPGTRSIDGVRTAGLQRRRSRRRRRPLRRADAPGVGWADAVSGDGAAGAGRGRRLDRGHAGGIDDSREAPGRAGRGDRAQRRR